MKDMKGELKKISGQVKDMIRNCDNKLNDVVKQVELVTNTTLD